MSHYLVREPQTLIDWSTNGSPVWPETNTLPWNNGNFAVTPSIVATPSIRGTGALKLTIADNNDLQATTGNGKTGSIRIRSSNEYPSFGYDVFGQKLGIWIRVKWNDLNKMSATANMQVYFLRSQTGATFVGSPTPEQEHHHVVVNNNHLLDGWEQDGEYSWNYVQIHFADPLYWSASGPLGTDSSPTTGLKPVPWMTWNRSHGTTGFDASAGPMRSMQIQFGGFTVNDEIYLDSLELGHYSKPQVVIGFDSSNVDIVNEAEPAMTPKKFPGYGVITEASTDTEGERTQLTNLKNNSVPWVHVAHSKTHPVGGMAAITQDNASYQTEIGFCYDQQETYGLWGPGKVQYYALPENQSDARVKGFMVANYPNIRLCRGVASRWCAFHPLCGDSLVPDRYEVGCFAFGEGHSFNQWKAVLEYAILFGTSVFFYGHLFETVEVPANYDSVPAAGALYHFEPHFNDFMDLLEVYQKAGVIDVPDMHTLCSKALYKKPRTLNGGTWISAP